MMHDTDANPSKATNQPKPKGPKSFWVIVGLIILVVVVIAGIVVMKRQPSKTASSNKTLTFEQKQQGEVVNGAKQYYLVINNRKIIHGPSSISVKKGDNVYINMKTIGDEGEDMWLKGYDRVATLQPGQEVHIDFTADKTGDFDLLSAAVEKKAEDSEAHETDPVYLKPVSLVKVSIQE
jgi:heme/copper-type cytochrome/quinol oxidase subunit 2